MIPLITKAFKTFANSMGWKSDSRAVKAPYGTHNPIMSGKRRLFVGVDYGNSSMLSNAIILTTQLNCKPPWVMGPKYPAVHAYGWWQEEDGTVYRLDAGFPTATLTMFKPGFKKFSGTNAAWEVLADQSSINSAVLKMCEMEGTPYDVVEAAAQVVPMTDTQDFLKGAYICTQMAWASVERCGPIFSALFRSQVSWLPEQAAQAWEKHPQHFKRVW